jgi:hypothetical protein
VLQAVRDAPVFDPIEHSRLLSDERGFQNVCICADIEPAYLRRRARRIINEVDLMVKAIPPPVIQKPFRSQRISA